MHSAFYSGAQGALVVCDITREDTLASIPGWVTSIVNKSGPIPLIVLANKYDLKDHATFSAAELYAVSNGLGAPNYYTSAKTCENVETAFHHLAELIVIKASGNDAN